MVFDHCAAKAGASRWAAFRVALFLLLMLAALDAVVAANARLWHRYESHPYRERLEACRRGPWDLVVVGGSPVMYGVNPAALSGARRDGRPLERVYNLGLPLATASEICLAVEHDLPEPPPRLLVYGVSATDFNEDRVVPFGPRQLMDLKDVVRWSRDRPEAAAWCARHFAWQRFESLWSLYFYRNGIRLWAADKADRLCPGICPEAAAEARAGLAVGAVLRSEGFQTVPAAPETRLDCLKAAGKIGPTFPYMENFRLGSSFRCLNRLLDAARRRGAAVVLIDMPVPADLDERLYPREFATYRAALADAARVRGTPLLSATRESVGLTDADFADAIHLNADGAARFSAWVRRRLEQP